MESTKAIYVLEERFFAGVQRCLGMRSGLVVVSGRCLVHSQNGKRKKREERRDSLLETTKRAKKRVLPSCRCENESFVGSCFVGLVVSAESVFLGGERILNEERRIGSDGKTTKGAKMGF